MTFLSGYNTFFLKESNAIHFKVCGKKRSAFQIQSTITI